MPDQKENKIDWTSVDWEPLIRKLYLYAFHRSKKMLGDISGSHEPLDFVHQSIEKTISGTREWNMEKADLFHHLASVINSDISHYRLSHEYKKRDLSLHKGCTVERIPGEQEGYHRTSRAALFWSIQSRAYLGSPNQVKLCLHQHLRASSFGPQAGKHGCARHISRENQADCEAMAYAPGKMPTILPNQYLQHCHHSEYIAGLSLAFRRPIVQS